MMGAVESHHPESISGNNVPIPASRISPNRPVSKILNLRPGCSEPAIGYLNLPPIFGRSRWSCYMNCSWVRIPATLLC